jgi:spermidine synthase
MSPAVNRRRIAIGVSALAVTVLMRDLPSRAAGLQSLFLGVGGSEFTARQAASFAIAFSYMFVPAFFMGVAFPLAGALHAAHGGSRLSAAVGAVLTYNTIGAIFGAAVSGFVLIHAFGIERSLQMLAVANIGIGSMAALSTRNRGAGIRWAASGSVVLLVALAAFPDVGRVWNRKYFAIYRNNQRAAFDTPGRIEDALANTDVLYYAEGGNEIISVIRPRGAQQAFLVNGRPEATTSPMDVQCQRMLGHLPMLLHPNPRKVFVLGTGTGMTLGATSIHPEVESIVLAEIEPSVLGATRTFGEYNHHVLDSPKLRIVFNDGRNYLAATRETFDVVTADPIHPWSGGAANLYTTQYFRGVARHLRPGGIACQWLPIYELTPKDLKTVVRTFGENFRYVMIFLTHYDAELIGSNDPIVLDEDALARRIAVPAIQQDLEAVDMGSAEDILSYFVTATAGSRAFAEGGVVNTDDNLSLEFSAPESMGVASVMGDNVRALAAVRENVGDALIPAPAGPARTDQLARWRQNAAAARVYDQAHALFLWGDSGGEPFAAVRRQLLETFPRYAPFRFLEREYQSRLAETPRPIAYEDFPVRTAAGERRVLRVSAVTVRIGPSRAVVMFVDNDKREIYGQRYFDGDGAELDRRVERFAAETLRDLRTAYDGLALEGHAGGSSAPSEEALATHLRDRVAALVAKPGPSAY